MQAAHQRTLRDGREYDRLFLTKSLENTNPILLKSGDTFDTLNEMEKVIRRYQSDTAGVAPLLAGRTLGDTCRNVWEFAYRHFQYRLDDAGVEQLRRPLRAWKDRRKGIDCDCYSILISTILLNLGIAHKLRKAKYKGNDYYQHIYVIVPERIGATRYYTIDPVVDSFDYETPFTAKFDKTMMPIQLLNGVPEVVAVVGAGNGSGLRAGFGAEFIGIGSQTLNGVGLGDVDGLDIAAVGRDTINRIRLHLENTLTEMRVAADASLVGYEQRIRAVLNVWDQPQQRTALLAQFAAEEGSPQGLSGLFGNFFSSIGNGISQAAGWVGGTVSSGVKAVATGVSNAAGWAGNGIANGAVGAWTGVKNASSWAAGGIAAGAVGAWTGVKNAGVWVGDKAVDLGQAIIKYNPLSILIRNAVLLAMKINLFRFAERLGYGYATQQQASAAGLDLGEWQKVNERLGKLVSVFRGLQGEESNLRNAILDGQRLGLSRHGGVAIPGLNGLGEPVTAAAGTAAATPILTKIWQWLKEVDWSKLVAGVKGLLAKFMNKDFQQPIPADYVMPGSEQEYFTNPQRFENPAASASNTPALLLLGVGAAALIFGSKA